jgi:hypothetical protein
MATLKTNTLTGTTTAGSIAVTGEGNSTTTNLQQGLAKSWLNYKGTATNSVRDSFNVGSVTDNGNGDYSVNFTNNMANANYMITGTGEQLSGNPTIEIVKDYSNDYTASVARIASVQNSTRGDAIYVNFSAHGDLA